MSATEVRKIVQLVFNMELLATSNMSEVESEKKSLFWGFPKTYKGFLKNQKITEGV